MPARCIMPLSNRKAMYLFLFLLFACLTAVAFLLWSPAKSIPAPDERLLAAADGLDEYIYSLVLDPAEQRLSIELELQMRNRTGLTLKEIVLRTYAGAYQSMESSPAASQELFETSYPNGFSAGGLRLKGVGWQGIAANTVFDDSAQTILRIAVPDFLDGDVGKLTLSMELTVPECLGRYGYYDDTWCFGNSLPILAQFSEGLWRTEPYTSVGDPFVSECSNYTVVISVPQGYTCASSAAMQTEVDANRSLVYTAKALAVRDFAFVASSRQSKASAIKNGVLINSYAETVNQARIALEYAGKALETFSSRYGSYPYPQLTLCALALPYSGMEYPGMMLLNSSLYNDTMRDSLELLIAHETAHQWFYALVGSDQFFQPWQDEALCEYSMLQYVLERFGAGAYDTLYALRVDAPMRENLPAGITPGSPLDYFSDMNEYSSIVYGRGAAMLVALDIATGGIKPFLKNYCEVFSFKNASRGDFESLLNDWSGKDLTPMMIDYLDTSI